MFVFIVWVVVIGLIIWTICGFLEEVGGLLIVFGGMVIFFGCLYIGERNYCSCTPANLKKIDEIVKEGLPVTNKLVAECWEDGIISSNEYCKIVGSYNKEKILRDIK